MTRPFLHDSRRTRGLLASVLAGALAALLVLIGTRGNLPGMALDGVAYVGSADALAHQGALRVPFAKWDDADSTAVLSHWAPGTAVLIAAPRAAGLSLEASTRLLLAFCALVTVAVLAFLADRVTGVAAAVLSVTLLVATPDLVRIHVNVWSEPPFLALLALLLATMVLAPDRSLRHGLLAAAAGLVRYAGVALGAAVALWALLRPGTPRARIGRAALALLPTVVAQAWWSWRTTSEQAVIRELKRYPIDMEYVREGWFWTKVWLAPHVPDGWLRTVVAVAVLSAVVAILAHAVRRARADGTRDEAYAGAPHALEARLYAAAALLATSHIAIVLASRAFADPYIPMNGRIFAPVIVLVELALAVAVGAWWRANVRSANVPTAPALGLVALGLWVMAGAAYGVAETRLGMRTGRYMTHDYWRHSQLLDWVRREGPRVPLYSNYPSAIYVHAGRVAREIPRMEEVGRIRHFGAALARSGGVFVAFTEPSGWLLPNDEVARFLELREVARFPEGVVWTASDRTPRETVGNAGAR